MNENPFFKLFCDKTLDELAATDETVGKSYYTFDKHPLLEAYWAAQTIALEKHYESLDERFLRPYKGSFQIRLDDRSFQKIDFEFEPDYQSIERPRTMPPRPCVKFVSEKPSPISCTGFRHESMNCIPFSEVSSMEGLIRLLIKKTLKGDEREIIFL